MWKQVLSILRIAPPCVHIKEIHSRKPASFSPDDPIKQFSYVTYGCTQCIYCPLTIWPVLVRSCAGGWEGCYVQPWRRWLWAPAWSQNGTSTLCSCSANTSLKNCSKLKGMFLTFSIRLVWILAQRMNFTWWRLKEPMQRVRQSRQHWYHSSPPLCQV